MHPQGTAVQIPLVEAVTAGDVISFSWPMGVALSGEDAADLQAGRVTVVQEGDEPSLGACGGAEGATPPTV